MDSGTNRIIARIAVCMLIFGLQSGVANAGKSGDYFDLGPGCCALGADLSVERSLEISTADAVVENGILKLRTTTKGAIYTSQQYWISNARFGSGGMQWSAANFEAFRKDFSFWPTSRVQVAFNPNGCGCTGYLAAYSGRGKLLVQKTFTSSVITVLDTGTAKGRIAYVLASFDGPGGLLGNVRYWVSVH